MKLSAFLAGILGVCACTFAAITFLPNPRLQTVCESPACAPTPHALALPGGNELGVEFARAGEGSAPMSAPRAEEPAVTPSQDIAAKVADLREALAAAVQIPSAPVRNETLAAICYRWAEIDPREALDVALQYQLQNVPGAVIENLVQQWAAVDLSSARDWIDAQQPSELRSEFVARLGYVWAGRDPEAAAIFVLSRTKPGPIQEEAVISILHEWFQRDRSAARVWAEKFPPGELRERALWETQEHATARAD